jgi:hypothetical protein
MDDGASDSRHQQVRRASDIGNLREYLTVQATLLRYTLLDVACAANLLMPVDDRGPRPISTRDGRTDSQSFGKTVGEFDASGVLTVP